ncbi:hypothetical protein HBIAX_03578 [Achromobacter xylosoxidans]|uniref:Uncharacterized protein n=2 Tax=Alcaligenaceae TaxID=506 RepID=A0A6S7FKI0_9BURK|nr:hypothetical protein LMG26846_02413 [Achromobacter insuavis]CAB3934330.1 hypothetical protein LMG5997_01786 [Achromobacter insolitus]CKI20426.1 Uncharacterised protein [Achromobacter xylosoxidans]CUJ33132.1 Uncharacterised protein [Achromobacter sp. 2789STDY5608621]CAB3940835.1 hypothetical protein LMG6000_06649 [Achromobacter insolitus]
MRYRANIDLMNELVSYLTAECCSGIPAPSSSETLGAA